MTLTPAGGALLGGGAPVGRTSPQSAVTESHPSYVVGYRGLLTGEAARVLGRPRPIRTAPPPTRVIPLDSPAGHAAVERAVAHLADLGLSAARLEPVNITRDSLGIVHVRLDRKLDGLPVYGEQTIVHLRSAGITVSGSRGPIPVEPVGDLISPERAAEVALAAAGRPGETEVTPCYFKNGQSGRYVRGYAVDIKGQTPDGSRFVITAFVNGTTAEVQEHFAHILGVWKPRPIEIDDTGGGGGSRRSDRPTTPPARDRTLYSGYVDLDTTRAGDLWVLLSQGGRYETRDAQNTTGENSVPVTDDNGTWGEPTDPPAARSAIDAHYVAEMTSDAFWHVLGIDSIDLQGKPLVSKVRILRDFVNAFWDGEGMNYGEGDGRTATALTTLDIGGHEITHGLTDLTAGLIYRGESGGLNEGFSDVGGVLVEWYTSQRNGAVDWNWTIGEKCWTPTNGDDTDGLRYMDQPARDGYSIDHYSRYPQQTEVHGSSGILNNAFYQLAETDDRTKKPNSVSGVVVRGGIGVGKAAKIFFRALIHYLFPRATFSDARLACVIAAEDLYGTGSVEVRKVKEAWSAVGVEDDNTIARTRRLA